MANEQQTPNAEFLVEQYKLLVDYRKYLGSLLMQMTGGVVAILTILIGLLGGKSPNVLRFAFPLVFRGCSIYGSRRGRSLTTEEPNPLRSRWRSKPIPE